MTQELDKKPGIERRFKAWLDGQIERCLEQHLGQDELGKLVYLQIMDEATTEGISAEIRREGFANRSMADVHDVFRKRFDIVPMITTIHYGSILMAQSWLTDHPDSKEAKIIAEKGDQASFNDHSMFFIDVLIDKAFPTQKQPDKYQI